MGTVESEVLRACNGGYPREGEKGLESKSGLKWRSMTRFEKTTKGTLLEDLLLDKLEKKRCFGQREDRPAIPSVIALPKRHRTTSDASSPRRDSDRHSHNEVAVTALGAQ